MLGVREGKAVQPIRLAEERRVKIPENPIRGVRCDPCPSDVGNGATIALVAHESHSRSKLVQLQDAFSDLLPVETATDLIRPLLRNTPNRAGTRHQRARKARAI